jgi:hypothetical protein
MNISFGNGPAVSQIRQVVVVLALGHAADWMEKVSDDQHNQPREQ